MCHVGKSRRLTLALWQICGNHYQEIPDVAPSEQTDENSLSPRMMYHENYSVCNTIYHANIQCFFSL